MKYLFIILLFIGFNAKSQESSTTLFAQCLFEIENISDLEALQSEIREMPITTIVRLDAHSQRAFIMTTGVESLTEEEFSSWFGEHASSVRCIQIGVKGVDEIKKYPFEDCE